MKRLHAVIIAAMIVFILAAGVQALQTMTMGTVCKNGHLLVPARPLFQQLGACVVWTEPTRTVTATTEDVRVVMQVDYPLAQINGRDYKLKVAPLVEDGHVMVPVRFSAEAFGYDVRYHEGKVDLLQEGSRAVRIISAEGPPKCLLDEDSPKPTDNGQQQGDTEEAETSETHKAEQKPINCDISGFKKTVLEADKPVLVDFWAPWCGPCLMMEPTLDAIARRYATEAKIVKVDISKSCNQPLVLEYKVHSIPYMAVFSDGQVVQHLVGVRPEQDIAAALDRVLQD